MVPAHLGLAQLEPVNSNRRQISPCLGTEDFLTVDRVVGTNRFHVQLVVPAIIGPGIVKGGTVDLTI